MSQALNKGLVSDVGSGGVAAVPWYQRQSVRHSIHTIFVYGLIVPGAVMFMLPFLWMVSTALKPPDQIFIFPPKWIPEPLRWQNFSEGWTAYLPFSIFLRNTLIITIGNVLGNLFSCSLAAYGFARLRARGSTLLFLMVLGTMMVPQEVTVIPQYILFTRLGWNNTWLPLMVPAWFGYPFFIFLLRQFFMSLPKDLDEAARIDGASSWGILFRIILPLSKPALAAVVIFAFIGNWNNFLYPLIYLRDMDKQVLAVGLNMFRGQYGNVDFHYMMAVSLLVLMPVLVVFFIGQRAFVQGIALTGLKG